MSLDSPRFSVVIPTFNRVGTLTRAIASVQRQTFADWELLVVDDGSADGTAELVRTYARRDERVRYVAREGNSGLPAVARNRGILEACGEVIAFLDSDDYWWSRHLELHARARDSMTADASRGLCYSHLWSRRPNWPLYGLLLLPSPAQQVRSRAQLLERNSIQCSAVSVSRALIAEHGGFNESLHLMAVEDYELWLRLTSDAPVTFIPYITGVYTSSGGISAQQNMEVQLANLGGEIGEPIGRRSRKRVAIERMWGIPAAAASFGKASLRRGR